MTALPLAGQAGDKPPEPMGNRWLQGGRCPLCGNGAIIRDGHPDTQTCRQHYRRKGWAGRFDDAGEVQAKIPPHLALSRRCFATSMTSSARRPREPGRVVGEVAGGEVRGRDLAQVRPLGGADVLRKPTPRAERAP